MAVTINASTSSGVITTADNSGVLQLQTNSGQTAMTIDTSQNVGIGTTVAFEKLGVNGDICTGYAVAGQAIKVYNGDTTNLQRIQMRTSGTDGILETRRSSGTVPNLIFGVDATERMRINSSGFLMGGGNTSSTNFGLTWGGGQTTTAFNCAQIAGAYMGASGSGGGVDYPYVGYGFYTTLTNGSYRYSGTDFAAAIRYGASGRIDTFTAVVGTSNNTISWVAGPFVANSGTSWTNSSDERLKNITGEITDAISKVSQLRAAEFTWKSDESNKPCVGLIAQDVLKVLPEAVVVPKEEVDPKTGEKQYLGVTYTEVIPLLTAAIKEQQTIITELKSRIEALEGAK